MYLLTETVTSLRQSEQWFWENEPRKVIAMIDQKKKNEIELLKAQSVFIAHCVWGGDPDKLTGEKDKKIAGIDTPVNPDLLKGWY